MSYWLSLTTDCGNSEFDQEIRVDVEDYFEIDMEDGLLKLDDTVLSFDFGFSWHSYACTNAAERIDDLSAHTKSIPIKSGIYFMNELFPCT